MSTPAMPSPSTPESKSAPARASAVRAPLLQRACSCAGAGECDSCKKKPKETPVLQRSAAVLAPAPAATAPPVVNRVLNSPGRPLDTGARSFMEPRFGRNFDGVRVHTDPQAAESARAVDAHAYTVGQHIVFDSGRYDPHSATGQKLLAHELAHTVQQRNVGHTPEVLPLRETPEYNHLENEAESIAQSVMHRGTAFNPPAASRPMLSRNGKKNATTTPPRPAAPATASNKPDVVPADSATAEAAPAVSGEKSERQWVPATTAALKKAKVKAWAVPRNKTGIVAVQIDEPLKLPSEKGRVVEGSPVLNIWQNRADAGALEAIIEPATGSVKTRAGLKQDRPAADTLQKIWLQKVGWLPQNADAKWQLAVGQPEKFPKADKATCNVDHILELQFGGDNVPNNMQMLDGAENQFSGRVIFQRLKEKAETVAAAFSDDKINTGGITDLLIHYDKVVAEGGDICKACCLAEAKAKTIPKDVDIGKGQSVDGKTTGTPYPLKAGSIEATVLVTSEKDKTIPLAESSIAENKWASTLISGFSLEEWHRTPKGGGAVSSSLDTASRFPASLHPDKKKKIKLNRAEDGTLKLPPGHENVKFHFDYLSEGVFNELKIEDEKYVTGSGTITPTSFFPKFDVRFDKEKFELAKPIPKDKLKLPIHGLKINKAEIQLQLAPEFKPAGEVEFSLDLGKRHLLDGKIALSGDANGLVAQGDVKVSLPGVDNAEGHIEYRNKKWSGRAEIDVGQIRSKLKYVESGSLVVVFNDDGMSAEGKVLLRLPGTKGVSVQLLYESGNKRWIFRGTGIFHPPGLEETTVHVSYDGEHLEGFGKTGFTYRGIHGDINVVYHDEKFSGEGWVVINKPKLTGAIHVKMREVGGHPKFSGEGDISYKVTDDLVASAGIEIDEERKVRVKGALAFPKPIKLLKRPLSGSYELFHPPDVEIPIPYLSIGHFGLNASFGGSLTAGYELGAELRDTKIGAALDPFDDNPDVEADFHATLFIGGSAFITGRVHADLKVDVYIAEAGGGLGLTATARLPLKSEIPLDVHYRKGQIEAEAGFSLEAGLSFDLAIDAHAYAEAGVWRFKIRTDKTWDLYTFHYDTGKTFNFSTKNKIHFIGGEADAPRTADGFNLPKPELDAGHMANQGLGKAASKTDPPPDD